MSEKNKEQLLNDEMPLYEEEIKEPIENTDDFDDFDDFDSVKDEKDKYDNIDEAISYEDPSEKPKETMKKKSRFIRPLIIALSVLLSMFIIILIFCIVTLPKDTVANNVIIEGIDVSGLTYDETLAAVESTHLFENQDITIECNGKTKLLNGHDIEITGIPEATAQKAFYYGKSGNLFLDGLTAMRLLVAKKDIVPVAEINYDALNAALGEFGIEVCGMLTQTSVDFTDTEAIITPGHSGFDYNTDTAREQILNAIGNEKFNDISVTLNSAKPDNVDVDYIDTAIYRDPIDAYYDIHDNEIMVIAEVYGRYCNRDDIAAVMDQITDGGTPVSVPYSTVTPKVFAADLTQKLFANTLGSYSTNYVSGGNRGKNVARAAELINGKILAPGEVFSFNDTVGDRSTENGFFSAPEYSAGQSVIGIGGGTCQVSTTLYSAALYADLGIVERTEHMMKVGYAPAGQDATVSYGSIDFKMKNTTDYPVKVVAKTGGGTITVSIVGTAWEPAREVKLKHSTSTSGANTVVVSKRLVYSEGKLISEDQLDTSVYQPHATPVPAGDEDDED